jgi:hypothetical protein
VAGKVVLPNAAQKLKGTVHDLKITQIHVNELGSL